MVSPASCLLFEKLLARTALRCIPEQTPPNMGGHGQRAVPTRLMEVRTSSTTTESIRRFLKERKISQMNLSSVFTQQSLSPYHKTPAHQWSLQPFTRAKSRSKAGTPQRRHGQSSFPSHREEPAEIQLEMAPLCRSKSTSERQVSRFLSYACTA